MRLLNQLRSSTPTKLQLKMTRTYIYLTKASYHCDLSMSFTKWYNHRNHDAGTITVNGADVILLKRSSDISTMAAGIFGKKKCILVETLKMTVNGIESTYTHQRSVPYVVTTMSRAMKLYGPRMNGAVFWSGCWVMMDVQ